MDGKKELERCLAYIEENLDKDLTAKSIAVELGCSERSLYRLFDVIHMPIGEYIRKRRIENAAKAISTGKAITEIADQFGFLTVSGFNRAFKKSFHMSPTAYREQYLQMTAPFMVRRGPIKAVGYGIAPFEGKEWDPFDFALHWRGVNPDEVPPEVFARLAKKQKGEVGVWIDPEEESGSMTYFFGPIVDDFDYVPEGMLRLTIPGATFAVFTTVPVSILMDKYRFRGTVQASWRFIYSEWLLQNSEYEIAENKLDFEFFPADRGTKEGLSPVDLYIPVVKKKKGKKKQ
ncbi:MAG TPA: helix-turn-helix domain-containing protein [Clostridiales bacterium]|nr:helix-turn-helix domain-containing protein [Clostridiales bacterium]